MRSKLELEILKDNLSRANKWVLGGWFLQIVVSFITFGLAIWSLVVLRTARQYSTTQIVQAAVPLGLSGLGIIKVFTDSVVLVTNPNTFPGLQAYGA